MTNETESNLDFLFQWALNQQNYIEKLEKRVEYEKETYQEILKEIKSNQRTLQRVLNIEP